MELMSSKRRQNASVLKSLVSDTIAGSIKTFARWCHEPRGGNGLSHDARLGIRWTAKQAEIGELDWVGALATHFSPTNGVFLTAQQRCLIIEQGFMQGLERDRGE